MQLNQYIFAHKNTPYIFDRENRSLVPYLENGVYYLEIAGKIHVDRNYPSKYTGNYKFYTQINSSAVGTNTSEVLNFSNLENMNFDEFEKDNEFFNNTEEIDFEHDYEVSE